MVKNNSLKLLGLFGFIAITSLIIPGATAQVAPVAIERAQGPRLATAIGHYGRARNLLLTAIREFDKGAKLADPSALIDAKEWRDTLVYRAEDLERILAPQPRATRDGVKFEADSRLIGEALK